MSATDQPHSLRSRPVRLIVATAAIATIVEVLSNQQVLAQSQAWRASPTPPEAISDADIARAARQQTQITDADVARATQRFRTPTDEELARVPIPAPVHVDALPTPALNSAQDAARGINFGDVARGYDAVQSAAVTAMRGAPTPSLIVFISFAMPAPTLERLVAQAQSAGATLVLRGLVDGSLRETVQRCQTLIGQRRVAIQIDPQAFDRFNVRQTPTFVLVKAEHKAEQALVSSLASSAATLPGTPASSSCASTACADAASFAAVRGDVSIEYALRAIAARDPGFEREAGMLLRRLPEVRP